MSALLDHLHVQDKAVRNEELMVKGLIKGLSQPHMVKVFFNGKDTGAEVYTDVQGYFATSFVIDVPKPGTYVLHIEMEERTEAGTVITQTAKVKVGK